MYHEYLNKSEIERRENADERKSLKNTAKQLVKKNDFQGGDNKDKGVEQGAIFGERNAEDMCIRASGNDVATRKISHAAEKRCITYFVLSNVYRIRKPAKSEN